MAIYNPFPATYQPFYTQAPQMQMPQIPQVQQPQQANNNINFVQGEAGAKAFLVAPGQSVLLMDSESPKFYIKSSDASGVPLPLRTFEYSESGAKSAESEEKKPEPIDLSAYVTKDEFEAFKSTVMLKKPKRRVEEEYDE